MKLLTIGFTKKSAEDFFTRLRDSDAKRVLDVRLNNVSQLAGFSKRDDLCFFLRELCQMDYHHFPELAPTAEMLAAYRKKDGDWSAYEFQFLALMESRRIQDSVPKNLVDESCLLCSEDEPTHCHRRLVAEYLRDKWGRLEIVHL
jgi:uncharacterized protein (DUF488 family)